MTETRSRTGTIPAVARILLDMEAYAHWETRALAEEAREHLRRIRVMFEANRYQAQLAMHMIAECRRFAALIEDMEARRILQLHDDQ
jgi:hypothetical protein